MYSSAALEICLRFHIGSSLSPGSLAWNLINHLRFVDDASASHFCRKSLLESATQYAEALRKYSFVLKQVISSRDWIKSFDPNHPFVNPPDTPEISSVLGHQWHVMKDELFVQPDLNITRKHRGAHAGKSLCQMSPAEIEAIQPTKRVMSRLVGQLYDPSGCFFSPTKICCKLIFSQVCAEAMNDWDAGLSQELSETINKFLNYLARGMEEPLKVSRALCPEGFKVLKFVVQSDGAAFASGFTIHLIAKNASTGEVISNIMFAACHISKHSIPLNEFCGILRSVLFFYRFGILFREELLAWCVEKPIPVDFMSDSTCSLFSLNPAVKHTQVLIRNASAKIHSALSRLSTCGFKVTFSHIPGNLNSSDLCTKTIPNPLQMTRESLWLHGTPELVQDAYPDIFQKFLTWEEGNWTFHQKGTSDRCKPELGCKSQCFCAGCKKLLQRDFSLKSNISQLCSRSSKAHPLRRPLTLGKFKLCSPWEGRCSLVVARPAINQDEPVQIVDRTIHWKMVMKQMDSVFHRLPQDFIRKRLEKRSLLQCITVAARFMLLLLGQEILSNLGFSESKICLIPVTSEIFSRIGCLTLYRISTELFPRKSNRIQGIKVHGFSFLLQRYSDQFFSTVFGVDMVCLISSFDHILIRRIFEHHHEIVKHQTKPVHAMSVGYQLSQMRSGPLGVIFSNQKEKIRKLTLGCLWCRRINPEGCPNPQYVMSDPAISKLLHQSNQLFHTVYCDIFIDVQHKLFKGQRKSHATCAILITYDLFSGFLYCMFIENGTAEEVFAAFKRYFRKFRTPVRIVADKGSQFVSLEKGKMADQMTSLGPTFQCLSAHTQFGNRAER